MTTIVGYSWKGSVVMGADSQVTKDSSIIFEKAEKLCDNSDI